MKKTGIVLLAAATLGIAPAWAGNELQELAELLDGRFDTHAAQPELPQEQRLVDVRSRVSAPKLGDYVFYQQINHRENLEVYRQRILVLTTSVDGDAIVQTAYAFNEPEWYVDADVAVFESIDMDDLDPFMPDGCEQLWTKTSDGFRGYVNPDTCEIISSRTAKPRRIEAESVLGKDSLSLAERGYDTDTGEQLFGTAQGEYLKLQRTH